MPKIPSKCIKQGEFRLSSESMTVLVVVNKGKIIKTAKVTSVFLGQPFSNLVRWMALQKGFYYTELRSAKDTPTLS